MPRPSRDFTGQTFHKLTAIKFTKLNKTRAKLWLWQCTCGGLLEATPNDVERGHYKSCQTCSPKKLRGIDAAYRELFTNYYRDGNLTYEIFKELIKLPCWICGKWRPNIRNSKSGFKLEFHGLDRIDNNKGHDRDNVLPCCWRCNDKRSKDSIKDFLQWIQEVYLNRFANVHHPL